MAGAVDPSDQPTPFTQEGSRAHRGEVISALVPVGPIGTRALISSLFFQHDLASSLIFS